eukprot:CAMPEP_0174850538 /NCGR_PEP_ID=MMETSP1114-20130205/19847_1 /TAXON_ID=312471 /ORGANISM="Neobodo designis, Strain CCAP 1951/1" /LENGTH=240 /DNA_ID=CAMNT_0016085003 /DNA_START=55 /DNA_END=777 /DNA_ORIENTATION=+
MARLTFATAASAALLAAVVLAALPATGVDASPPPAATLTKSKRPYVAATETRSLQDYMTLSRTRPLPPTLSHSLPEYITLSRTVPLASTLSRTVQEPETLSPSLEQVRPGRGPTPTSPGRLDNGRINTTTTGSEDVSATGPCMLSAVTFCTAALLLVAAVGAVALKHARDADGASLPNIDETNTEFPHPGSFEVATTKATAPTVPSNDEGANDLVSACNFDDSITKKDDMVVIVAAVPTD